MNPIYFFSPVHTGTHFVLKFLESHPDLHRVVNQPAEHQRMLKVGNLKERIAIHCHAPLHIRKILANPLYKVQNPIVTIRDPVKSMISRCARSKDFNNLAGTVIAGHLSIQQLENAFYFPIDLDLDRLQLLTDLCNHVNLKVNDYVIQTSKKWEPVNSEVNELHKKLTSTYETDGLNALVKEMPIPFLDIKAHSSLLEPFYKSQGYKLNW